MNDTVNREPETAWRFESQINNMIVYRAILTHDGHLWNLEIYEHFCDTPGLLVRNSEVYERKFDAVRDMESWMRRNCAKEIK